MFVTNNSKGSKTIQSNCILFVLIVPYGQLYTYREVRKNDGERRKLYRGILHPFFSLFVSLFWLFAFRSILLKKSKDFVVYFFAVLIKYEIHIKYKKCIYSECFVFPGVFCKNICEILAKCKIRKVYSRPMKSKFVSLPPPSPFPKQILGVAEQKNRRDERITSILWTLDI